MIFFFLPSSVSLLCFDMKKKISTMWPQLAIILTQYSLPWNSYWTISMLSCFLARSSFKEVWNLSLDWILIPWSFGPVGSRGTYSPVGVVTLGGAMGFWLTFISYWKIEIDTATMMNRLIALRTSWVWFCMNLLLLYILISTSHPF